MATSRALIYFVGKRSVLPCAASSTTLSTKLALNPPPPLRVARLTYADQKSLAKSTERSDSGGQVQVGFAEVVKENTKSAWYVTVIIAGVGVTGLMFYAIFRELFSSKSPNSVYSKALDRIARDPKVIDAVGEPIKAYGEETRRGRRGHVRHLHYEKNGIPHMRMQFYIQGVRNQATVHLEVMEDSNGKWQYRYLFVQLKDFTQKVIVLEDRRSTNSYKTPLDADDPLLPEFKLA